MLSLKSQQPQQIPLQPQPLHHSQHQQHQQQQPCVQNHQQHPQHHQQFYPQQQEQQQVIFTPPPTPCDLPPATVVQNPVYIVVPKNLPSPLDLSVKATCGLGITQLILGVCLVVFAIIHFFVSRKLDSVSSIFTGIWFGLWVTLAGIFGTVSSQKPQNKCLNGLNMGFSVVSCFLAFIAAFIYGIGVRVSYRADRSSDTIDSIAVALLVLTIGELCVAFVAMVFTCNALPCCKSQTGGGTGYIHTPTAIPTPVPQQQQYNAPSLHPMTHIAHPLASPPPYSTLGQPADNLNIPQ